MKLRMRDDSLRFRLTQGEVKNLARHTRISESVHFSPSANGVLTYAVVASEDVTQITAVMDESGILVKIPLSVVRSWVESDQTGIEHLQPVGAERALQIVIEKDFQCLRPRPGEDDNFPHPDQQSDSETAL